MSTIPNILVTDSDGTHRVYDIYSKLANDRNIFLTGEINNESSCLIIAQLLYLNSVDSVTPICLYINSPGGEVMDGLVITDIIKTIKAPVYTYCIGSCSSAAALIFVSGDRGHRFMYPHSRLMIHAVKGTMNGPMADIMVNYALMGSLNEDVCALIAANTQIPIDSVRVAIEKDKWLNAEEALKYGFADIILGVK